MKIVTEMDTLTPEQLHTITDLELMRADGWEAIEDMGPSELGALEQQRRPQRGGAIFLFTL